MRWKTLGILLPLLFAGGIVLLIATRDRPENNGPAPNAPRDPDAPVRPWWEVVSGPDATGLEGPPPEGTVLVYARSADSTTLDPASIHWGEDAKVAEQIYEPLVRFGPTSGTYEPCLAESWEATEGGTVWTFRLREGVRFHDGTEFDAGDVVFTFERYIDENHPFRPKVAYYGANYDPIESVEAVDARTVRFRLKQPSVVFLETVAMFSALIVSPEAVREHGEAFPRNPVGTGPYRLDAWEEYRIVLRRSPDYRGPPPWAERAIVTTVPSPQTAVEKLRNGEVHFVDHLTLADAESVRDHPTTRLATSESTNTCYLAFNDRPEAPAPYRNPHFRRAVALALDRAAIDETVYYGMAEEARGLVPPVIWGDRGERVPYVHDLAAAREALARADLPEDFEVEIVHMTFGRPYVPEPQKLAEFLKIQLERIGLRVTLRGYNKAALGERITDPAHPICIIGWNADYLHPDNFYTPLLHGAAAGDTNLSFFDDADFNAAVDEARRTTDAARQVELYRRAHAILRERMPILPLVHVPGILAESRDVAYEVHPLELRLFRAHRLGNGR